MNFLNRVEGSSGQSSAPSPHQQRIAGAKLPDFQIHVAFKRISHVSEGVSPENLKDIDDCDLFSMII